MGVLGACSTLTRACNSQAAGAHEAAATGHGESQLHQLTSASRVGRASAERPIFIEIGYARAVIRRPWKLVCCLCSVGSGVVCMQPHASFSNVQALCKLRS
eukprot:6177544-Pleurochrysis_carterae.AAC.3